MSEEKRYHSLGEEFRAHARNHRRQLITWVSITSAGGLAFLLVLVSDADNKPYMLDSLLIPLLAWLGAIILSGAGLLGMVREAELAAAMYHRQSRRERQHAVAAASGVGDAKREIAARHAREHHSAANRHQTASTRWVRVSKISLTCSALAFAFGAAYAMGLFMFKNPLRGATLPTPAPVPAYYIAPPSDQLAH